MKAKIVTLPGDGIGVEVVAEGVKVLKAVAEQYDHQFTFEQALIGGCAMDATGEPLPAATLDACKSADAVLMGAVGGPKWADPTAEVRPEQGLLGLRKSLALYANLRPVHLYRSLLAASPLRPERLEDTETGRLVDLVVVRELTGGIYFGPRKEAAPSEETDTPKPQHSQFYAGPMPDDETAFDTMFYAADEIRRIAHIAFRLAQQRRGKVTSVDKANVLAASRLWRRIVGEIAEDYPEVTLENILIDAATMHLLRRPSDFDVILTANMFGDILTDEASMLAGSMGMLPSASIGDGRFGVYEPIHGSAPDIVGQEIANPLATILSVAMLLRHTLELEKEAQAVENAVDNVLQEGYRTRDIAGNNQDVTLVGTVEMGNLVKERVNNERL